MASVAVAKGKAVAVNRVLYLAIAAWSAGPTDAGSRRKSLTLRVETFKYGAPVAHFVVRSGFGRRMRTRRVTQDQCEAVAIYNAIK